MATFRYVSYSIMSGVQLASSLVMRGESWTEVVNGNAGFSGLVTVPDRSEVVRIANLRAALEPFEAALYVQDDNGNYVFGGPIVSAEWNPGQRTIQIEAVHWRSWYYGVALTPAQDGSGDVAYSWTDEDQADIANDLFTLALAGGVTDGRPPFAAADTTVTGVDRDLNIQGLDFKYIGEVLDTISSRDRGFEWGVAIDRGAGGAPEMRPYTVYPQSGGSVAGLLFSTGGNILAYPNIKNDASARRTRVWSYGDGEPAPYAYDEAPAVALGHALLWERADHYSRVTQVSTLASHSRAMRAFLTNPFNLYTFTTTLDAPPVTSYAAGDRGRLILRDDWYDLDLPAVRVVQRTIKPSEQKVEITVDLNDAEAPEVDEGGTE